MRPKQARSQPRCAQSSVASRQLEFPLFPVQSTSRHCPPRANHRLPGRAPDERNGWLKGDLALGSIAESEPARFDGAKANMRIGFLCFQGVEEDSLT
jgi:hypothetical protein